MFYADALERLWVISQAVAHKRSYSDIICKISHSLYKSISALVQKTFLNRLVVTDLTSPSNHIYQAMFRDILWYLNQILLICFCFRSLLPFKGETRSNSLGWRPDVTSVELGLWNEETHWSVLWPVRHYPDIAPHTPCTKPSCGLIIVITVIIVEYSLHLIWNSFAGINSEFEFMEELLMHPGL